MTDKAPIRPDKALLRTDNSYLRRIATESVRTVKHPLGHVGPLTTDKAPILTVKRQFR